VKSSKGALDIYPQKRKPLIIKARISRINSIIGISLKKAQIISLLKKDRSHGKILFE